MFSVHDSGVTQEVKPYYQQQAQVHYRDIENREYKRQVERDNWVKPEDRLYVWVDPREVG